MDNNKNGFITLLIILLIVALMIPITGIFILPKRYKVTELDTPLYELNNYSLREIFGDSESYENQYTNLTLDTILPILNNKSLKQVFEDGNLITDPYFNLPTYWAYGGESYYDNINKKGVLLSTTGTFSSLNKSNILNVNDVYYGRLTIDNITGFMTISDTFGNIVYSTSGIKSFKEIAKQTFYSLKRNASSPVNAILDNIYLYNMTYQGISSLTLTQMDFFFGLYQDLKNNTRLTTGYDNWVYADGENIIYIIDQNQWSPIYETALHTLTQNDLLIQIDRWLEHPEEWINFNSFAYWTPTQSELVYYYQLYLYYLSLEEE